MSYFEFEVVCYNEEDYTERLKFYGLVCAENYGDAAQKVADYYGNLVIDIKVSEWDVGSSVLEMSKEVLKIVAADCSEGEVLTKEEE